MHLVPLLDLSSRRKVNVAEVRNNHPWCFPTFGSGGFTRDLVNLEGYCTINQNRGAIDGYTQLFHSFSLEVVDTQIISSQPDYSTAVGMDLEQRATESPSPPEQRDNRYIPRQAHPKQIIDSLGRYMQGLNALGCQPPFLLQITYINMSGVNLALGDGQGAPMNHRQELRLPSAIISEYDSDHNYESVVEEQMQFLWNAFGVMR